MILKKKEVLNYFKMSGFFFFTLMRTNHQAQSKSCGRFKIFAFEGGKKKI